MPDLIGFEIATITFVAGLVLGAIAWAWITSHVHVVIGAVTRATTPPAGDVAALDAKISGLGTQLAALEASIGQKINAAITAAAQPKS